MSDFYTLPREAHSSGSVVLDKPHSKKILGSFIPKKKLFVAEWLPHRSEVSWMQRSLQIWELKIHT